MVEPFLPLESVDEILKCEHSNKNLTEQYCPVVVIFLLYKVVLTFESVDEILKCEHSNKSLTEQYCPVVAIIMLYKVVLTFEPAGEINMKAKCTEQCFQ